MSALPDELELRFEPERSLLSQSQSSGMASRVAEMANGSNVWFANKDEKPSATMLNCSFNAVRASDHADAAGTKTLLVDPPDHAWQPLLRLPSRWLSLAPARSRARASERDG